MAFTYNDLIWTSPSGTTITFVYDGSMSDGVTHNLAEFTFANKDDKYFQDRTISHDDYAFTLFVTDQTVLQQIRNAFDEKVTTDNVGKLQHPDPTIGTFNCVVQSVKYVQNAVKGSGVCTISVVFRKQIKNLLSGDSSDSSSAESVYNSVSSLNELQAEAAADSITTDSAAGNTSLINSVSSYVSRIKSTLSAISAETDEANILFTNGYAEVLENIDDIVSDTELMIEQIQNLIQLPAVASDSWKNRLSSYKKLVDYVLGTSLSGTSDDGTTQTNGFSDSDELNMSKGNAEGRNILVMAGVVSLACVSAVCYSAGTTETITESEIKGTEIIDTTDKFLSRSDIAKAIVEIQNFAQTVTEELSAKAESFGEDAATLNDNSTLLFFDQYFDYSVINKQVVADTIKNLNSRLVNAQSEKTYVTEEDMNIVKLCYKIYGTVNNNTIQFLIASNNLHGDKIYLVPSNTEIKYY